MINNPSSLISIVTNNDNICQACPHLRQDTGCKSFEKTDLIDQRHLEVLDLKVGQVISWQDAKQVIKIKMTKEKFDYACFTCEWKKYGVCSEALTRL